MTKPLADDEKWIWACNPHNEEEDEIAVCCVFVDIYPSVLCRACPCSIRRRVKKDDPMYSDELHFMG